MLFSKGILNAQIKVSELAATPVDVLNDFYFKGGSLNGKFKMSLEKVMANVDVEEFTYKNENKLKFIERFTGLKKTIQDYSKPVTNMNRNNSSNRYQRITTAVPEIFSLDELTINKGSNNASLISSLYKFLIDESNTLNITNLTIPSTFIEFEKSNPIVEITKDKLFEILLKSGEKKYYLMNTNNLLNNFGKKTIQISLANEVIKADESQNDGLLYDYKLSEVDYLWRLFNIKNEIYLVLTFRDIKSLKIPFGSAFDMTDEYYELDSFIIDPWGANYFSQNTFYLSPKNQNITTKIFLEPRFCLFFFKLKAVN